MAVFREVTHALFTFSFLSLLAVHELHGRRSQVWSASIEVWAYSSSGVLYNFVFANLNFVIRLSKKFEKN